MSRKEGRIELASIEDSVDASMQGLKDNNEKSKERLITVASNKGQTEQQLLENRNGKKTNVWLLQ